MTVFNQRLMLDTNNTFQLISKCWDKCDVNNWNFHDTNLWPLIMRTMILQEDSPSSAKIPKLKPAKASNHFDEELIQKSIENLSKINDADVVFFERIQDYTVKIDNLHYNKDIDPYFEEISKSYKAAKLQVGPLDSKVETYYDYCIFDRSSFKRRFFQITEKQFFDEIAKFIEVVCQEISEKLSYFINKLYLESYIVEFYANNYLMRCLFKHISPRAIFLSCYYDPIQFGLINNCHLNNIISVELQHGSQGINPMYQGWKKIPKNGYPLLPNYFWCWNKIFVQKIMEGRGKSARKHLPIEGGNLWLNKEISLEKHIQVTYSASIRKQLDSSNIIILIGLQWNSDDKSSFEGCIPEWLENEISNSKSLKWLVRLHPAQYPHKENFRKYLQKKKINILDFEQSTNLPLYEAIKHSTHFISCWSSSSYEAAALGKCSAVVDKRGKKTFSKFIDEGLIHFLRNKNDLKKFLENSPTKKFPKKLYVNPQTRQKNIEQILQNKMVLQASL